MILINITEIKYDEESNTFTGISWYKCHNMAMQGEVIISKVFEKGVELGSIQYKDPYIKPITVNNHVVLYNDLKNKPLVKLLISDPIDVMYEELGITSCTLNLG